MRPQEPRVMKLSYALADFAALRREGIFYVDKMPNAASSLFAHRYAGLIPELAPLDGLIRVPELDVALLMIEQLRQG